MVLDVMRRVVQRKNRVCERISLVSVETCLEQLWMLHSSVVEGFRWFTNNEELPGECPHDITVG
jgi:hypothetical protein